jgi:type I restriction enzyme S subunit
MIRLHCTKKLLAKLPLHDNGRLKNKRPSPFAANDGPDSPLSGWHANRVGLTQSILSKAFRGDLTADWRAQNPDLISGENSAEALLKRIQAQRAAQPKGTRKKHAGKNKGAAT